MQYRELMDLVRDEAALISQDGRVAKLPEPARQALLDVLTELRNGHTVAVVPCDELLTTQQAADLLHVSRPTLVKLLKGGDIPFEQPGRNRRVRLADLEEFQRRRAKQRRQHLDALVSEEPRQGAEQHGFVATR